MSIYFQISEWLQITMTTLLCLPFRAKFEQDLQSPKKTQSNSSPSNLHRISSLESTIIRKATCFISFWCLFLQLSKEGDGTRNRNRSIQFVEFLVKCRIMSEVRSFFPLNRSDNRYCLFIFKFRSGCKSP